MLAFMFLYLYFLDRNRSRKVLISVLYALIEYIWNFNVLQLGGENPHGFGNDLCELFQSGDLQLTFFSIIYTIFNPGITKSVYFGRINESDLVTLKTIRKSFSNNIIFCGDIKNALYSDLSSDNNKFWLDLESNAEPFLLQVLNSTNNWPVPKYLGACGNVIMEDYKGDTLNNYYAYSWKERAYLAIQLLKMANVFTFRHSNFSFYFTDLSPDNLVVDDYGRVSLIDLDNVIIAQRSQMPCSNIHVSTIFDEYYFSFSSNDICSHCLSDHNYLAVCQYILIHSELMEGGLLHDIPRLITDKYPQLQNLLNECAKPQKSNRISAGENLEVLLKNIVKNFKWDSTYG